MQYIELPVAGKQGYRAAMTAPASLTVHAGIYGIYISVSTDDWRIDFSGCFGYVCLARLYHGCCLTNSSFFGYGIEASTGRILTNTTGEA